MSEKLNMEFTLSHGTVNDHEEIIDFIEKRGVGNLIKALETFLVRYGSLDYSHFLQVSSEGKLK